MKLHLPKVLWAAVVAAMAIGCASAVDSTNITWDGSGVWNWNGTRWVKGTPKDGFAVTDWVNGYEWNGTSDPDRGGDKGPILLVQVGESTNDAANTQSTSDGGGLVAIKASGETEMTNLPLVTVGLGGWGGYVYVEEGLDIKATLTQKLKNMSNNTGYSVVAGGTLTFGNNITFDGGTGSSAHNWFVGKNGSITIDGNLDRNGKGLDVDVEAVVLAGGSTVTNREARTRTVVSATRATANNDLSNATVQVLDVTGRVVSLDGIVTPPSGTSISITDYEQATLVWNNTSGATWTNAGTGWYKDGDTSQTDTSFIHGDKVVFRGDSNSVTLGGDITFDTMTVEGGTAVNLGRHVLTGNGVNVTGGTLTLSSPNSVTGDAGNMQVKSWTTSENASISYTGAYRVYNSDVTFNADMTINGELAVVGNSTVNVAGGKLNVSRIFLHANNGANHNEKMYITGGVVNVTHTAKNFDTSAGIILGFWKGDNNSRVLSLEGGVLNAIDTSTMVGWDSKVQLLISGGEANLYALGIDYAKDANHSSHGGSVTLSGGRLNIGQGGIASQNNNSMLNVSGGTIGTLTTENWTLNEKITLNATGAFTIDTEKRTANVDRASSESGEGGGITITGTLTGTGNLTKIGAGTLTLNKANSAYSGNITVSGGSLKLAQANAFGTGTLTVATGGTLIVGVENALATGTFTVETGGTLIVGENIRTSLHTDSIAGTLTLEAGSRLNLTRPAGTDHPSLSIGTLGLSGDATIGMSFDQNLLTSFSVGTYTTGNSHTLTLDFSEPLVPITGDVAQQTVASGLSGATLNLTIEGQTVEKVADSDTWSKMIGRTRYTWTLADNGDLTFSKAGSGSMDLVWNGGANGTWAQGEAGGESWLQDGATTSVVFENGDNVTFASGDSDLTVDGTIVVGTMSLEDSAAVTLRVAEGDTSSSLTAGTLTLGSATMTLNGLTTTVNGDLTVGADKTATITLTNSSLTVNGKLSTAATSAAATSGLTLTGDIYVGGIEAGAGSTMTINGAVERTDTSAALGITAGDNATVSITGNVTSATALTLTAGTGSSITLSGDTVSAGAALGITAEDNATVSITGNVTSATALTLTAGTGSSITLSGDTISAGAGGVTINGNVTIGNDVSTPTFTHGGNLTIESGTTTIRAYRDVRSGNITIAQGATLDASAGTLWHKTERVGSGNMYIYGTYKAKNLAYDTEGTTGRFHNNADHFQLGNGAEVIVTVGTTNDAQGMYLKGTDADNTYTITFEDGATSTMKFQGGLKIDENASRTHNLVFNVEQNAAVTLSYTKGGNANSDFWNRLTTLTKSGAGSMSIDAPLYVPDTGGNATLAFAGTIDVQDGTLKLGKAEGELVLPNLKLTGGTTRITNNTTLTTISGDANPGNVTIDGGKTLTVKNSIVGLSFAKTVAEDSVSKDNGTLKIDAGGLLAGTVSVVDADASDSKPGKGLPALMSACTLQHTDVIVSASDAIDAKALATEDFISKTFALNIMSGVTIGAGTTFSLELAGMGNYKDVVLHCSVQPMGDATNSVALFSASDSIIDLDTTRLTQVDYTGAPVVFSSTNGTVVDVWATYNVPEPTTGTLSVLALAALAARRRRRE